MSAHRMHIARSRSSSTVRRPIHPQHRRQSIFHSAESTASSTHLHDGSHQGHNPHHSTGRPSGRDTGGSMGQRMPCTSNGNVYTSPCWRRRRIRPDKRKHTRHQRVWASPWWGSEICSSRWPHKLYTLTLEGQSRSNTSRGKAHTLAVVARCHSVSHKSLQASAHGEVSTPSTS